MPESRQVRYARKMVAQGRCEICGRERGRSKRKCDRCRELHNRNQAVRRRLKRKVLGL